MRSRADFGWRLCAVAVFAVALAACSTAPTASHVLEVPGDYASIREAVDAAPDGATISVAPGSYAELLVIERPLTLVAQPGSVELVGEPDTAAITIRGVSAVTIEGFTIVGGATGIAVRDSSTVVIANNRILDSSYRGVDVVSAEVTVIGNLIEPAPGPFVIGIRVANASSWPESVISGNAVRGASAYGIAVNFANATVDGNEVVGGDRAGIAINEMSRAEVRGNTVDEASRYGILVHDMSHAVISSNRIIGADEPIKLIFHSTAELSENQTD